MIVLKQKRGASLSLTLKSGTELEKLGMSFEKFVLPSAKQEIVSPKNRTIILRKVEPGTKLYDQLRSP